MTQINLPYNSNAEASLLGNLLQYKNAVQECLDLGVEPEDFYIEKNRHIYQTILSMSNGGEAIDVVTLLNRLEIVNLLQKAGGKDYIISLVEASISSAYTKDYAKLVKSQSILRQITKAADEIKIDGQNNGSVDDILEKAKARFDEISRDKPVESIIDGSIVFNNTFEKIKELKEDGDKIKGVKSQYKALDDITAGFQNGDFIIIAARPSVGKTALGINLALNASSCTSGAVAFFSLEMSAVQIGMRMVSIETGINLQSLRTGRIDDLQSSRVNKAIDRLKKRNLFIDESSSIKVRDILSKCRKLKNSQNGLSIVFIDYIGLIDSNGSEENRQQEVSKISRELKSMARELNVPVIALSQLRRLPENSDRKPRAQDLRESGALEQDADLVILIHRPDYKDSSSENEGGVKITSKEFVQAPQKTDLIIAKHRNGPSGMDVHMQFDPNTTRYYALELEKEQQ